MNNWRRMYTDVSLMLEKYQNDVVPKMRIQIEELKADNERLREMWAKAVSDLSKVVSKLSAERDIVSVVRCKDCKWYAANHDGSWIGCAFDTQHPDDVPKADDFCSYGESIVRKNEIDFDYEAED